MRRASLALPAALFLALFVLCVLPAAAQTTNPPADLAKENAALRAYVEKLEARVAELEAKLKQQQKKPIPTRPDVRPFPPIPPYGYELPQQPFKLPVPAPRVIPPDVNPRIAPAPPQPIPDTWRRHQFNGREFYLIPLR